MTEFAERVQSQHGEDFATAVLRAWIERTSLRSAGALQRLLLEIGSPRPGVAAAIADAAPELTAAAVNARGVVTSPLDQLIATATPAAPTELASRVVSGRSPLSLLGVDIAAPGKSPADLAELLLAVRDALAAATDAQREYQRQQQEKNFDSSFFEDQSLLGGASFSAVVVLRDSGATLRRLLAAATLVGLIAEPMDAPHLRPSCDTEGDSTANHAVSSANPFPNAALCDDAETPTRCATRAWSAWRKWVSTAPSVKLAAAAGDRHTWLLRFRLATCHAALSAPRELVPRVLAAACHHTLAAILTRAAARAFRSGDAAASATLSAWREELPWIWHADPVAAAERMAWCDVTGAIVSTTDECADLGKLVEQQQQQQKQKQRRNSATSDASSTGSATGAAFDCSRCAQEQQLRQQQQQQRTATVTPPDVVLARAGSSASAFAMDAQATMISVAHPEDVEGASGDGAAEFDAMLVPMVAPVTPEKIVDAAAAAAVSPAAFDVSAASELVAVLAEAGAAFAPSNC